MEEEVCEIMHLKHLYLLLKLETILSLFVFSDWQTSSRHKSCDWRGMWNHTVEILLTVPRTCFYCVFVSDSQTSTSGYKSYHWERKRNGKGMWNRAAETILTLFWLWKTENIPLLCFVSDSSSWTWWHKSYHRRRGRNGGSMWSHAIYTFLMLVWLWKLETIVLLYICFRPTVFNGRTKVIPLKERKKWKRCVK
jgi:hypothetical protein